jgi:hypothetical protein
MANPDKLLPNLKTRSWAGGIFTSDGNMAEEADPAEYDPHRGVVEGGVSAMLKTALDALARLA